MSLERCGLSACTTFIDLEGNKKIRAVETDDTFVVFHPSENGTYDFSSCDGPNSWNKLFWHLYLLPPRSNPILFHWKNYFLFSWHLRRLQSQVLNFFLAVCVCVMVRSSLIIFNDTANILMACHCETNTAPRCCI